MRFALLNIAHRALQLHTLEDFPAHSNFCELALVSLGHHQVFVHVGDHVRIRTPHGKTVAPLVTGENLLYHCVKLLMLAAGHVQGHSEGAISCIVCWEVSWPAWRMIRVC